MKKDWRIHIFHIALICTALIQQIYHFSAKLTISMSLKSSDVLCNVSRSCLNSWILAIPQNTSSIHVFDVIIVHHVCLNPRNHTALVPHPSQQRPTSYGYSSSSCFDGQGNKHVPRHQWPGLVPGQSWEVILDSLLELLLARHFYAHGITIHSQNQTVLKLSL